MSHIPPTYAENGSNFHVHIRANGDMDKYPAKTHALRVAQALGVDNGLIVLAATKNVNLPNSDMPAPFRQDRYFYYLTGCNESDCYVTYNIESDRLTLWLPPVDNNWRHIVFYGNGSTTQEALDKYDIDEARYIQNSEPSRNPSAEEQFLLERFKHIDSSFAMLILKAISLERACSGSRGNNKSSEVPIFCLEENHSSTGSSNSINVSLRSAMNACRVIKDEHEIELIRKANDITAAAHINVFRHFHGFTNEAAVEAAYISPCISRHAKEQAYDPIIGSGQNAAVLHYSANLADFGDGQTVVIDAGCEVKCYASDVTRTLPINKTSPGYWPSKEAEEIYRLVEKMQESCIKRMLPGNKYIEITWHAHRLVIDGLLKLGILKGDPKEIFHAGTSTAFMPHGLGHHVGLDVHDVSPVPHPPATRFTRKPTDDIDRLREAFVHWDPDSARYAARLTRSEHFAIGPLCHASVDSVDAPLLRAGMVVTVEPGIYFNQFLLMQFLKDPEQSQFIDVQVLKRYIPVGGVRIEDDILITKNGYKNLTSAPKGEEMLTIIRRSAEATKILKTADSIRG